MKKTVVLVVLDGWGRGKTDESNPVYTAKPENIQFLEQNFPHTSLQASGISVGLPWGETGNSEVGHLTLGAGKVLYQYYPKITIAIKNEEFFKNDALMGAFSHAKKNKSAVNFVGLLSKGNVHASLEHLLALIQMANKEEVPFKLHLFADGKDTAPRLLESNLALIPQDKLATLIGRYYALDREGNWDLTKQTYDSMTDGKGKLLTAEETTEYIKNFFTTSKSEEFLPPLRFGGEEKNIVDGEAVIFFNFREDSIRQIASAFIDPSFSHFPVKDFSNLYVATMTPYSESFKAPVAFPPDKVENCLGKVLSDAGLNQLRLAETYKYAHITYFFNGFKEEPLANEYRVVIPSTAIPHPDEHPEMMARAITARLLSALTEHSFDFILVNYANPDTIAHTGNFKAAEETVKLIDEEIGKIYKTSLESGSYLIITSDHGNIERLVNPASGRIETQHDPNPVPFYLVHPDFQGKKFEDQDNPQNTLGILSDVAPTILALFGLPTPPEMNGENLLKKLV